MNKNLVIAALATVITSQSARSEDTIIVPTPTETPVWVAGLKCSDLLTEKDEINWAAMQPFSLWLHGYLTGLASALPLDGLSAKTFHLFDWTPIGNVDAGVLAACVKHRDWSAFEAAITMAAFSVNLVSRHLVPLRGSDGKWE